MRYKICFNEAATKALLDFLPTTERHNEFIQTRLVEWANAVMKESGIADLQNAPSMVEDAVGTLRGKTAEIEILLYREAETRLQIYTQNEIELSYVPAGINGVHGGYFVLADSASQIAGFFEDAVQSDAKLPHSSAAELAVEVYSVEKFNWE